ncbi:MAG: PAS domain S-box protein [Candidatus Hodarchaeales archaeon]
MAKPNKLKDLKKVNILAIDDDEWFLRLLIKKFRDVDPGFILTTASNVEDAINILEMDNFDCILCDHKLPGTIKIQGKTFPSDGLNLMRKFTEMGIESPVIFVTGQGSEEIASQALLSGASGYFIKRVQSGYFSLMATSIRQTVERYWIQKELQISEARYRDLFENSAGLIFIFDTKGRLQESNKNFFDVFCYDPQEAKNLTFKDLAFPDDCEKWQSMLNKITEGNEENQILRSITKNGDLLHLDFTARPIYSKDKMSKKVIGIQAIARDITHQVMTQQALIDSEEKHRAIIEGSTEGIIITDSHGIILDWNHAAVRITGLKADDVIGNHISQIFKLLRPSNYEKSVEIQKAYRRLAEETKIITPKSKSRDEFTEFEIKNLIDGTNRVLETIRFSIEHSKGYRMVLLMRDVTERRKVEAESKAYAKRFQTLIEQSAVGVWITDLNEITTYVNESLARMLGYSVHEMIGTSVLDYLSQKGAEQLLDITRRRMKQERIDESYELEFFHRSGKKIQALVTGAEIRDEKGNLIETYGFIRDISAQKETTTKLESTQKFLKSIIDSMTDGLYTYDLNHRVTMANQRMAQILGYKSPNKLIGKTIFDLFPPKEHERVIKLTNERMSGIPSQKYIEIKYITAQGNEVNTRVTSVPLIVNGEVSGAVVTVTDISERTKIEDILHKVQEEYQTLVGNLPLGLIKIDKLGQVIFYNQRAKDLLYFTGTEDLTTLNVLNFYPFTEAGLTKTFRDLIYQKIDNPTIIDTVLKDSEGKRHFLKFYPLPVRHEVDGTILSWLLLIDKVNNTESS